MKKEWRGSLTLWWIVGFVMMFAFSFYGEVLWDKQDWIFLFLFIGVIVLNVKLNKLLSRKK